MKDKAKDEVTWPKVSPNEVRGYEQLEPSPSVGSQELAKKMFEVGIAELIGVFGHGRVGPETWEDLDTDTKFTMLRRAKNALAALAALAPTQPQPGVKHPAISLGEYGEYRVNLDKALATQPQQSTEELARRIAGLEQQLAEARAQAAEDWSYCLSIHWLHAIQCNHEARTDEALCVCGWRSMAEQTVGLAVAAWIMHVRKQMGAEPRAGRDLEGTK